MTAGDRVAKAAGVLAFVAGCAIAWMDARPSWDDTGVTAGALLVASSVAAFGGVRWWLAALLVAGPLLAVEIRGLGWGAALVLAFALAGGGLGAVARTTLRRPPI
jgi:hypothetical protein